MSLPRELLDELLSGYMDGELSRDERIRVEQMLAADPAVRDALRLLREQSGAVRASIRSTPGLDAAFSERVLAATFAEADRLPLGADHPVRKAAKNRHSPARAILAHQWLWVGGLAMAAGLTLAAILMTGRDGDEIVANAGPQPRTDVAELAPETRRDAGRNAEAEANGEDVDEPTAALAAADPQSPELSSQRMAERIAAVDSPTAVDSDADRGDPEASPKPVPEESRLAEESPRPTSPSDRVALRAVLVYEVNLTPLGLERNVINRAFREAEIRVEDQREIDDALVGYLRNGGMIGGATEDGATENGATEDAHVSVLFLEGSGKRLEKLMMALLMAPEEVHSVGFSLAMDPPVMAAVDTLREVDAKEIRVEEMGAVARSLTPMDAAGAVAKFTAGDRAFFPLRRDSLAAISGVGGLTADEQPDIIARTFLIIRTQPSEPAADR